MATVSKSFTATGNGPHFQLMPGETATYSVSGTFVGTVVLEVTTTGGSTWRQITSATAATSGRLQNDGNTPEQYRFRCTARSSGTIETALSDVADVVQEFRNRHGDVVFRITDDGVDFPRSGGGWFPPAPTTTVADGNTLQETITAAGVAGGGLVQLGAGIYLTDKPLQVLYDNVHIRGLGAGLTTIRATAGAQFTTNPVLASGAAISGMLTFVGADNISCSGIAFDARTNAIDVNGIEVKSTGTAGAGTPCTNFKIFDNHVSLGGNSYHAYAIWALMSDDGEISGNLVDGFEPFYNVAAQSEGIEVYGGKRVNVHDNIIRNVGGAGINIGTLIGTTPNCVLEDVLVHDNTITGCLWGIHCSNSYSGTATGGLGTITDGYVKDTRFDNNTIGNCWQAGILIRTTQASSSFDTISVSGNTIRGGQAWSSAKAYIVGEVALRLGVLYYAKVAHTNQAPPNATYWNVSSLASSYGIFLDNQTASVSSVSIRNVNVVGNQVADIPITTGPTGAIVSNWFTKTKIEGNTLSFNPALLSGTGNSRCMVLIGGNRVDVLDNTLEGGEVYSLEVQSTTRLDMMIRTNRFLNWNARTVPLGTAAVAFTLGGTDFDIVGNTFDSLAWGGVINLNAAGIDKFLLSDIRFLDSAGVIGTGALVSMNADKNWAASTAVTRRVCRKPLTISGVYLECIVAGTTAAAEPTWNLGIGARTTDGTAVWITRSLDGA